MGKFNSTTYHTVIIDLKEKKKGASKNGYKKSQQTSSNKQHEIA